MNSEPLTPAQRAMRSRLAAFTRWAGEPDRVAALETARTAFADRFERQVDPDRKLDPETRLKRADAARRAHMQRLALASSKARKAKRKAAVKH